ncbi:MAG TPA: RNA polymerase sigma factor [Thermoanaerobaculia bacterium]|jgi:RNA polymerase sigma-70 factor (ECF subfamily)|nr:RNA polymerase sigma factor [Thermoanaerobaculia bacterium]
MQTRILDDSAPAGSPDRPGGSLSDEEVVRRVLAGERSLFEILMRRYNRRLYRVARGIVGDDHEAEDVVQDAYVRAFHHLDQFAERARFATWLTRIAVYEAMARSRRRGRIVEIDAMPEVRKESIPSLRSAELDPEQRAIQRDLRTILEAAIDDMPTPYRLVLMLRDVEGLSTAATAECLDLEIPAVKTRLHRARGLLRRRIAEQATTACREAFAFEGGRCDRVVEAVLARIAG